MKKLILILAIILLSSCDNVRTGNLIINKIELNDNEDVKSKYKVYIDTFPGETILYTNTSYKVGDTIK